jgi:hypothetical protein
MGEQFLNFPLFMTLVFLAGRNNQTQKIYRKIYVDDAVKVG